MSSYNLLSPKEIKLIKKWEDNRLPINVIRSGIEEALKRFIDNYPHRRDEPPSLLYCSPTVQKHWKRFKEASVGLGHTIKVDDLNEQINAFYDMFQKSFRNTIDSLKEENPRAAKYIKEFVEKIEKMFKIDNNESRDYLKLKSDLNSLYIELLNSLKVLLDLKIVKQFMFDIKREIGVYRYKMNRDQYRSTRRALFNQKISIYFKIPPFEL